MAAPGGRRRALLVVDDGFGETRLDVTGASLLEDVLRRRGFDAAVAYRQPLGEATRQLDDFFGEGRVDDVLLLLVAGPGAEVDGDLLFPTAEATLERLREGSVPAEYVKRLMDASRAGGVVVVVDTSFAESFQHIETPKGKGAPLHPRGGQRTVFMAEPSATPGQLTRNVAAALDELEGEVTDERVYEWFGGSVNRWSYGTGEPIVLVPASEPGLDTDPVAASDLYATEDLLGYGPYADAITAFIRHPETRPPLTIGIKAPWGAGKTSLMRMVQARLDPGQRAPVRLTAKSREALGGEGDDELGEVRVGTVLRRIGAPAAPRVRAEAPSRDWRPTVWFNPWMYQSGEQVWAGFAHEVIAQITDRMPRGEREHFWLSLNLARVDEDAVRRKVHRVLFERLLPRLLLFAVLAVLALLGIALDAVVGFADELAALLGGGAGVVALVAALQAVRFRGEAAAGSLDRLVREPAYGMKLDEIAADPGYAGKVGFLHLVQTDIKRVLDLVATAERPLVVFVDDLDRCAPGTVTQVIEAINLFLAGEFRNCIFVLGMEPEVVAAHIEVAHEALVQRLGVEHAGTLGWRFLEKIVQLPLSLPPPARTYVTDFLGGFLATVPPPAAPLQPGAAGEPPPADTAPATSAGSAETAVREEREVRAERREELTRRLGRDSPELEAIVKAVSLQLGGNPREIKRFVNVFRFYAYVQQERAGRPADLVQVAKLAVLAIRWPHLRDALGGPDGDGTVLSALVTALHAGNGAPPPGPMAAEAELCAFLRAEPQLDPDVAALL